MTSPTVTLLTQDSSAKLTEALLPKLKEAYAKAPATQGLALAIALIQVRNHEKEVVAQLPRLFTHMDGLSPAQLGEVVTMTTIAQQLLQWPGNEKLAISAYQSLRKHMEDDSQFSYMGMTPFLCELAQAHLMVGNPADALPILKQVADDLIDRLENPKQGNRRNYWQEFNANHAERALVLMLKAGDKEGYTRFVEAARKIAPNNKFGGWTLDEEVKQFNGTSDKLQALPWLFDQSAGLQNTKIVYEIRGAHPHDRKEVSNITQSRARSNPALEKPRTLKFFHGATPAEMKPLGSLETKKAFGAWSAKVPEGEGFLKIVMVEKDANGAPVEITSPAVRTVRGKNLLRNANFDGLAKRTAKPAPFTIPGWQNLPVGYWKNTPGGPLSGGSFVQYYSGEDQERIIEGEKIPIEPGKSYVQSAWLRAMNSWGQEIAFGRRYLNEKGEEVKIGYTPPTFHSLIWRRHWQKLVPAGAKDGDAIPENAAFIQPILKVKGGGEWAGLHLTAFTPKPVAAEPETTEAKGTEPKAEVPKADEGKKNAD